MCYNRAMMAGNIVLVGFMGAGKSSVSEFLAKQLGRELVSTDALIESREGRTITEIFKTDKEPYFRQVEKDVVVQAGQKDGLVIDCGGGVVLDAENIANLKENGCIFYLKASPDEIYLRIKKETHRPLLYTENPLKKIEELLAQRETFYEQADYIIDTNGRSIDVICQEIVDLVKSEK